MRFAILLISYLSVINAIQLGTNIKGSEPLVEGFVWGRQEGNLLFSYCLQLKFFY